MRKRKRNYSYLRMIIVILLVYVLLLLALVYSEKGHPGAEITSIGSAIWYSLATFSTVGYGDMTPKTPMGHVIGVIFLLMSMGILVALVGSVVSVLTSEGFPMMRLGLKRKKNWYFISEFSAEADTLAKDILAEDEDAVIIFGESNEKEHDHPDYPCFFINVSPVRIIAHKKGVGQRCKIFFLGENEIGRNLKAVNAHNFDADIYACTMSGQDRLADNIYLFHTYDCCARCFWRDYPLEDKDKNIVILGFGNYGMAILERAILTNVSNNFGISYHVFGDSKKFREIHTSLGIAFGINEERPGRDSIYFYDEAWTARHDVIKNADRIILCQDNGEACWDDMWQIQRYYATDATLFLRSNRVVAGVNYFGTNEQIYSVNQIVRTRLNDAARAMNDLYRASVEESYGWDELSDHLRQSKIAAADHFLMKVRILLEDPMLTNLKKEICLKAYEVYKLAKEDPEAISNLRRIEHARWVRFYAYYNWNYGIKENDTEKENPMICEFDALSEKQKAYFDRAWELLGEIAKQLR